MKTSILENQKMVEQQMLQRKQAKIKALEKFMDFEAELGSDNEHHDHHIKKVNDSQEEKDEIHLDQDLPGFLDNEDVETEMGDLRIQDAIQKDLIQ